MTTDPFDRSTLLVAATRAEAHHLPADARVLVTGIGKVRAATTLTRALVEAERDGRPPIRQLISIGTAGALRAQHTGIFFPSVVIEHDISATELRAMGYPLVDRWELPDGDGTVLASGDTFVADPVRRDVLARHADLVDMEGAAVAHVAADFGIPCRMVKIVSDAADESAMDWPSVVDAAARRLGEWCAGAAAIG
ncbi:nucleosidase [Gordonia sp. NPDC062954]|uniref:nucleosidase n=1 Tax=Gordonia sp. NPDC062954 TaxID=3364003 RepID=UPI0037C6DA8E